MGQIVGGAAKPKRCNINQLSQLGTPAAGEHILVSSDNSMNAAGQGNFDCYIVGDGTTAATALEIKMINPEIYESTPYSNELDLASYTKNSKFINSSNAWATQTGANSINISVTAGETIKITSNSSYGAIIAFLRSNTTVGTAVDFSASYNGRISLTAGQTITYTIPEDCTLLYVFNETSTDTLLPSSISVSKQAVTKFESLDADVGLIKSDLYTTGEAYTSVDFSILTTKNKYINNNNAWSLGSASYNNSYLVPADGATKVRVTSNTVQGAIIAFLKSETPYTEAVDFSAEQPAKISLVVGTTQEFSIPSDCTLVYVFNKTRSDNLLPSSLELLKEALVSRMDVLQEQVEELSAQVEDIDTDAIAQLELQVNGGNEDVPIILERGYAQKSNYSTVQIVTNYTIRVLSSVLKGKYNIKTNSGYVIRGVTAWNGGAATEGTLPTENITGVTGCTNLVTQAALTEYNCDGTYEYTIITFCKENASATISPSEDIVESCTGGAVVGIEQRVQGLEASVGTYRVIHKALFMGDSINYGLASYFNGTQSGVREVTFNRISDYFAQMTGAEVDNIAARGTGYVADTRNLGNGWEKAQVTDYSNYNLVCICLGINDYIQHVSIGTLEANAEGTVIGNMTRIINKIMTDNPLCKVVIFSPYNSWGQVCDDSGSEYQVADYYGDESTDYALGHAIRGHTLTEYITAIDSVCAAYHIQHVKLSESGMINKANIKKVLADGLHPIVDVRPMLAAELFGRKMYD